MCKVLRIAHYEYYYQRKKKENRYKEANEKLDKEILKEYENSKGGYGSPKIQKALEKRGIRASQKRVARRMKKIGLKSIIVKKYRTSGSKGKVDDTNKPNLLAHNPKPIPIISAKQKQEKQQKTFKQSTISDIIVEKKQK